MIYIPQIVSELKSFYGIDLDTSRFPHIKAHLEQLAIKMLEGLNQNVECLYTEINNYNQDFIGWKIEKLQKQSWSLYDCKNTIAVEYGYANWKEVESIEETVYDKKFEKAISLLLSGGFEELSKLLNTNQEIILQKSPYGHKATLLHYTASNGVELWRQQVPMNLGDIIHLLIEKGADQTAKMKVYGRTFTTKELFTTSTHPYEAGIGGKVVELFS